MHTLIRLQTASLLNINYVVICGCITCYLAINFVYGDGMKFAGALENVLKSFIP
jgi:hypothetical protein